MKHPDDLLILVDRELSRASQVGKVALLVTAAMMTVAVGWLGVRAPSLPSGARGAFALIGAIGVLTGVLGLRALRYRGALLARQRVIACRVGVVTAAVIVLNAALIGYVKGIPAAYLVAGFGGFLLLGTTALLRQENRKLAALVARREVLERQLKVGR